MDPIPYRELSGVTARSFLAYRDRNQPNVIVIFADADMPDKQCFTAVDLLMEPVELCNLVPSSRHGIPMTIEEAARLCDTLNASLSGTRFAAPGETP